MRVPLVLALAGAILLATLLAPAGADHSFPATYRGSIDGGGTVEFDVSADGSAVTRFAVTGFNAFPCATSIDSTTTGNIPISGTPHSFSTSEITGTFDRTQHATGTFKAHFFGPSCTTPTRSWTATTTTPPPASPLNTTITNAKINKERRQATFRFTGSGGVGSLHFKCKLDRAPYKRCSSPKTYKHLTTRQHVFKVQAVDSRGKVDPTPAKRRFRI